MDQASSSYIPEEEDLEFDETAPAPSKRAKTGAGNYLTKFNVNWTKTWPFIQAVKTDSYKFLCTVCNRQVSCGHMGKCDVERHISKEMHKSIAKSMQTQATLSFKPVSSSVSEKVKNVMGIIFLYYNFFL
jgi:hypothetical protein